LKSRHVSLLSRFVCLVPLVGAVGAVWAAEPVATNEPPALPLGHRDFQPSPARPIGFRGDTTGRFPGATPPTEWNVETGHNVRWIVRLPFASLTVKGDTIPLTSHASPIVAGGKVLVCEHPDVLVCLDADTGAIRWRSRADVTESLPEPDRARLHGALEALAASGDDPAARRVLADAAKQGLACLLPSSFLEPGGAAGGTPASDGHRVFVAFGTGAVAAFDLESGQRRWLVAYPWASWNHGMNSPLLVNGVLVHLTFRRGKAAAVGLDAETGKERWVLDDLTHPGHGGAGSPVLAEVAGEPRVVLPEGSVLNPATGARWAKIPSHGALGGSPATSGSFVVFQEGDYHAPRRLAGFDLCAEPRQPPPLVPAQKLGRESGDLVSDLLGDTPAPPPPVVPVRVTPVAPMAAPPTPKWDGFVYARFSVPRAGGAPNEFPSPLIHEDRVYALNPPTGMLEVYSPPKMDCRAVPGLSWRGWPRKCWPKPSPTLAGRFVFVATPEGPVHVVTTDAEPSVVGRNPTGPSGASPFFQGGRVYLRTVDAVICVGS
jgi:outer membrane protein assembly factor BamB